MKKFLLILFIISSFIPLIAQTATAPTSGDGSVENPYQITSLENLYWIYVDNSRWSLHYIQTTNIDASNTSTWYSGGAVIGNSGWIPIGTQVPNNFSGSYNGQNYNISDIYSARGEFGGLFAQISSSAQVLNVNIVNIDVDSDAYYGAGLVGMNNGGTITNCSSSGTISGKRFSGGLVGANIGGTITNSHSTATVTTKADGGFSQAGGFVHSNKSTGIIDGCYSTGIVGAWSCGGFAYSSESPGIIRNCYSSGNANGGNYTGGFIGRNSGIINACYASGNVAANAEYVGGFIGESSGTSVITNCYSLGDITRSSGSTAWEYGGFVGRKNASISYCYSIGSVYYTDADDPTANGFVGRHLGGSYDSNFWHINASNQSTATGATGKSTTEMKLLATFTDLVTTGLATAWDFEGHHNDDASHNDYWDIDTPSGSVNSGYPFLSWENGEEIALPVELSSFIVENTLMGVLCGWTTESETENLGFILERRTAGTDWLEIASYKTDDGLLGQGSTPTATNYEYLDVFVETNATYEYRLADVDYYGIVTYHAIRKVNVKQTSLSSKVEKFTVLPAYPNPFNPSTTLRYGLDDDSHVTINIYDITGLLITTLVNTEQTQGWYSIIWNGTNKQGEQIPAGLYLSRITSGNEIKTTKLMLLK